MTKDAPHIGTVADRVRRRILRTGDAAAYTGLSQSAFEKLRSTDRGPRFIRLGGRAIGYDVADLDEWLDQQREATEVRSGELE